MASIFLHWAGSLLILLSLSLNSQASEKDIKTELQEYAREQNFSTHTITIIQNLQKDESVIPKQKKQPELEMTFSKYKNIFLTKESLLDLQIFLAENFESLEKIEREYHVNKEVIVSLMFIETRLGRNKGKFNLTSALYTLATQGKRKEFFLKELKNLLKIIDKNYPMIDENLKGSWAGAFGMVQFMPSSFLSFATDGDGDGFADITNSNLDSFASAANYMKKSGWTYNSPIISNEETESCKTKMIGPKEEKEEIFVCNNFNVILKWNRSDIFAGTVGEIYNYLLKLNESDKKN